MLKSEYSKREEEIKKYYDDSSEYGDDPEDDEDTAESFAEYLTGEDIFWDVLFDSTCSDYDYINADVAECLKSMKENKASYDLRQYEPLMNRTNYDIYKAIMREKGSDFSDHEDYLIREIENSLNMVSEQVAEFDDFSERQLSAFILAILKRKVMSERKIVAEREAQIGFSNKRVGSADILFYMNEEVYANLGVLELKFYNDFREIKQVLGYLNASFQFGGTVTVVKGNIEKAIEKCIEYLKSNGDELHVLRIDRLSGFALKSRILLPDSDGKEINLYHFFLDVAQDFHRKMAEEARR